MFEAKPSLPHAGRYSDEDAMNCETDKFDARKVKVLCPGCKTWRSPLCSGKTKILENGWQWVGCDHQVPYNECETTCRCGQKYIFTVYTPQ